jgi:hypothetical protein
VAVAGSVEGVDPHSAEGLLAAAASESASATSTLVVRADD